MNKRAQLRVAYHLIIRDFLVTRMRLKDDLINILFMVGSFNIVFGLFGPLMGLQERFVGDTFVGTVFGTILFVGFARAMDDFNDLTYDRLIDYKRILPLTLPLLMCTYLISYVLHVFCVTVPLLFIGKLILANRLPLVYAALGYFVLVYVLVVFFIMLLFLWFVFNVSYDWFRFNIWQRVLTPFHQLGCTFYTWKKVSLFSPFIAQFLLLNPATYCNEGLRSTLFGFTNYLPWFYTVMVLIMLITGLLWFLLFRVKKKCDWV